MKKRLLALLLVLMLVVSLLPVGALADNGIVTLSYNDEEGSLGSGELKTIHVVVKDSDTDQVIEEKDWHNVWSTNNDITVSISSEYVNSYDILSASISKGSSSSEGLSADSYTFKWTYSMYEDEQAVLTVYLSKQFVEPEIVGGEIENTLIYYTAYEPALLKLLYDNGVSSVDENTRISGVKFHYVRNYFLNSETQLGERLSNGDELKHFVIEGGLTDTSGNDNTPNNIRYIEISYSQDAGDIETVRVYSNNLRYINVGGNTYEIESNKDSKNIVVFYYEQSVDSAIWTPYDVQFIEDGDSVGEDSMPNPPEYYAHEFVAWTTQTDGGTPFISTTIVEDNTVVYCQERLSTSERPTQIYVMNNNNALKTRLAELFKCDIADIDWSSLEITVYGENGRQTNPDYGVSGGIHNGWEDNDAYYLVYNYLAGAGEYENESLTFDEISKITVTANKSDNMPLNPVTINRGIYDGDFSVSVGENASTWRLFIYINDNNVHNPGAGPEPTEVNYTVNYYYDGVLDTDKTETGTGKVGDKIESVPDKSGTGYCLDHSNLPFTLTDVAANNVITVYYATDANDNDIPDYKETKYGVIYEFVSDTDGKELPESGMPALPSDSDTYLTGITVENKGELTYEAVSVDDGTWTFTGWDATQKEMVEGGITFTGTWTFTETKKHPVNIVIYRNGDTDEEYSSTRIGEYAKGETVDLSELNINDYYSSANGFEFKGWYNDDGWNKYKDGDPDNTLGDSIIVNGWTNIICMVTDHQKVVVKSVIDGDKDNAETIYTGEALHGTNLIEYLEDNVTLEQKPGYELDKWYNWDWYGHEYSDTTTVNGWTNVYVTYTPVEPDAPTVEDLAELKLKVQIDCIDLGVHPNRDYDIEEGTFTTEIELVNGVWQCDLSVQGSDYLTKYISEFGKHEFSGSSTKTKTLVYGATGWTLENPSNDRIVFNVCCVEPDAPTYDVLKDMIKVQIDCINKEVSHSNADYDLIENSYDLGTITANADGTWSCTLTVKSDAYVAKYNETKPGHTLVDAYASKDIELVYSVDGKWSRADTSNNIAAVFDVKCEAIPATPITPLPTEGDIAELIDGKIIVDCVNDDVNHANKNYGLVDDALMNVAMTDSTTVKVTLSANVYLAKYNDDDTSAKHSLDDGQSETVTITLKYVDDEWTLPADAGELPATIKVVCETPVTPEPTPDITGFTKELVTDRRVYWNNGIAYPEFYRGDVIVDEGDSVTLICKLTVTGTEGTEYTLSDAGAEKLSGSWSGTLGADGTASVYVSKTFSWKTIRNSDALYNTAYVYIAGEDDPVESDTVKIDVDIDWDYDPPADDDDDTVYVPNWLNTTDHFAYLIDYEDGEIKPENNITRAEVATIFFRLLTDDARARFWSSENDYTDVATDSWYNNAVSTLSNMGIINGYEDGTFQPNASITRAEFTAIATRFFDYTAEYDGAFNDVASGSWYADYVQAAVDMGLVDGYPDGGFHPNSYITRAEAVTIVNRVLNRVPHEDYLLSTRVMNTWPDNVYGAWYYADMQEATNSHDYDWIRVSGERVEEWTEKLTERDWAALEQQWSTAYSG